MNSLKQCSAQKHLTSCGPPEDEGAVFGLKWKKGTKIGLRQM